MSEYKESDVIGTSYQRGRSMYFENPRNGTPSLFVREEIITILNDRVITEQAGEFIKLIDDLSVSFQLRNPLNNEIIEGATSTYQDVFILLFSLYWHIAEERDIANIIPEPILEQNPESIENVIIINNFETTLDTNPTL